MPDAPIALAVGGSSRRCVSVISAFAGNVVGRRPG